jgi:hypothetical protein
MLNFSDSESVLFTCSLVVWLALDVLSFFCIYEQHTRSRPAQRDILSVLTIGMVFRTFWFAFVLDHNEAWSMIVLNRAAIAMQCTGVLVLFLLWAKGMVESEAKYREVKMAVTAIIAAVWFVLIVTMIIYKFICSDDGDCVWYAINLLYVGFVSFFVAIIAMCYGLYVRHKLKQATDVEFILSAAYISRKRITHQLLGVCVILVICFTARAFCFTITYFIDIKGAYIYPWLYYQVNKSAELNYTTLYLFHCDALFA